MDEVQDVGGSLRRITATLIEIAQARLELGAVEVAEQRAHLAQQALAATCALFGLGIGLVFGVLALAWWLGPPSGALVLALAALVALVAALAAALRWQRLARERAPLLHDTLEQLRCDARLLARDGVP